jgi:hypothetical protein
VPPRGGTFEEVATDGSIEQRWQYSLANLTARLPSNWVLVSQRSAAPVKQLQQMLQLKDAKAAMAKRAEWRPAP